MIVKAKTTMFPMINYVIEQVRDDKFVLSADDELIAVRSTKKEVENILSERTRGME